MKEELSWNSRGLLNPISSPLGMRRAPYFVTLGDLVGRFAASVERCKILRGFLEYRAALHAIGITEGFQWIDGSFMEDIETLEGRPPGDIDVVTFYKIPQGETQDSLLQRNTALFPETKEEKENLKAMFRVDGTMSTLDTKQNLLIKQIVFWYSLWAHRRDQTWKGFVQIDLNGKDDANALTAIEAKEKGYGVGNED
jgi:hypothetical protein